MIPACAAWSHHRHIRPDTAGTYDAAHDIDHIAIERAANGTYDPRLLNAAEQQYLVVMLAAAGISERDMAARMGIHERYISRWKHRARAAERRAAAEQLGEAA